MIEDLIRFMRNEGRALGLADPVVNPIKIENSENDDDIRVSFTGNPALLELIRRVTKKIAACIVAFAEQDVEDIGLAVDEACTNVIQHSCEDGTPCAICLTFILAPDRLSVSLTDNGQRGQGFDPGVLPPVDTQSYLNNPPKGGFGVHLIKKVMDSVDYSVSPKVDNCLTMVKYAKGGQ